MAVSTQNGGDLQLNQLLARVASSGISSPALLPSSSGPSSTAARYVSGIVRLVEVVLKPGKRAHANAFQHKPLGEPPGNYTTAGEAASNLLNPKCFQIPPLQSIWVCFPTSGMLSF